MEGDHGQRRLLRFEIVHREVSDIGYSGVLFGQSSWTRKVAARSFVWDIARPESGSQVLTRTCAHCAATLKIRVDSLDLMAERREQRRRLGLTICIVSVLAALAFAASLIYFPFGCLHLAGGFALLVGLGLALSMFQDFFPLFDTDAGGSLGTDGWYRCDALRFRVGAPHSGVGHSVASVESH